MIYSYKIAMVDKEDCMNILDEKVILVDEQTIKQYYGCVYIVKHISKDKYYIGKKNFNRNWKSYLGSGKYLKRAINKYGKQDFEKYVVALVMNEEDACKIERELIDKYDATNNEKFYNIHEGGSGGYTLKGYSDEQKKQYKRKMSKVITEKIKNDPEFVARRNKMARLAQQSEEYKKNASESQKKRYENEEERIKTGKASKRVWDNYTPEEREKKLEHLIELNKSDEKKERLSKAWSGENNPKFGTTMSEETKQMLANSRKEKCSKKVYMYDEEWNFLRKFDSREEVKEFLNTKGHSQLLKHMRAGSLYRGYHWSDKLLNRSQTTIERVL